MIRIRLILNDIRLVATLAVLVLAAFALGGDALVDYLVAHWQTVMEAGLLVLLIAFLTCCYKLIGGR